MSRRRLLRAVCGASILLVVSALVLRSPDVCGSLWLWTCIGSEHSEKRTNLKSYNGRVDNKVVGSHRCIEKARKVKDEHSFWHSSGLRRAPLYIRSAYVDFRVEPPSVRVLTIMSRAFQDEARTLVCSLSRLNKECNDTVRTKASVEELLTAHSFTCFYKEVLVQCHLPESFRTSGPPEYVGISLNKTGRKQICTIRVFFFRPIVYAQ